MEMNNYLNTQYPSFSPANGNIGQEGSTVTQSVSGVESAEISELGGHRDRPELATGAADPAHELDGRGISATPALQTTHHQEVLPGDASSA